MLLQDTPPDTSSYMIAGYVVFFVVSAIYLFSLLIRSNNLKQDLSTLESVKEESAPVPAVKAEAKKAAAKPKAKSTAGKSKSRQVKKKVTKKK